MEHTKNYVTGCGENTILLLLGTVVVTIIIINIISTKMHRLKWCYCEDTEWAIYTNIWTVYQMGQKMDNKSL